MAVTEACGLWMEQRIEEELKSGTNPNKIGTKLAGEITKYFETTVKPDTIRKKAERVNRTNVQSKESPVKLKSKPKLEKLEKKHGGAREGAGRKPKVETPKPKKKRAETKQQREKREGLERSSRAMMEADRAILMLEKIWFEDPFKMDALNKVEEWIKKEKENMNGSKKRK